MEEKNGESIFIETLGDSPFIKILDILIDGREFDYTKNDIMECAEVSKASVNRILPMLLERGVIKFTRKIGKEKLYILNRNSPIARKIVELKTIIVNDCIDREIASEPAKERVTVAH
ncbi:MAG: winged helix-turn-helix domain-containing protein [Nanoarchaeota archaeon]|nr:winged helix-turn-helix domain-containing protein [Nanoarchaeota archaeon]MBU1135777.1 winged helix-turn-helix domain-containing protein [Nanoarchaeota archaeon]MBU2520425.1 winged helix-turn-helix domain-containing protein [Nanoarchaeota archaeon]